MAEEKTLSQWEVDALLAAFAGSEQPATTPEQAAHSAGSRLVKNYDFRRPDKFSKEQLRSFKLLYENFARLLSTTLSTALRGPVGVHLTAVEQVIYSEYSDQLPKPTILCSLGLDPLPGRAALEINLPIAFAMIDRMLGGTGEADTFHQNRQSGELSDIEVALIHGITTHVTEALGEAWADIAPIKPRGQDIAFSSELMQVALPNEVCVLVTLEIKVINGAGTLSLCMPYTLLEPIIGRLSTQLLVAGSFKNARKDDPLAHKRTLRQLERVILPVLVQLGSATISINDLLDLEPGDVICLDTAAGSALDLLVDGHRRGRARPGVVGTRLAIQVEEMMPPDTLLDDTLALAARPSLTPDDMGGIDEHHLAI